MADQVHRLLEAMVPELEDYQRRNLFTASELQSIVQQRTAFEYRLQRRLPLLSDYLHYIQYELNLNALRRKRRRRLTTSSPSGPSTSSPSDHAILSRICFLFERALRRFHLDHSLWLQYVHFLRSSASHRLLSRVFPRMHLLLPHAVDLWLLEGQYHVDEGNVEAMRVAMQRALRLNPNSPQLWLRFFGWEVEYIAKVMERKRVLGINVTDQPSGDIDIRYKASPPTPTAPTSLSALDEVVLHARLPSVIFNNAIARVGSKDRLYLLSRKKRKRTPPPPSSTPSLSTSLPFRLAFLALIPDQANPLFRLKAFTSNASMDLVESFMRHNAEAYVKRVTFSPLIDGIYQSIERDFSDDPQAWGVRAKRAAGQGGVEGCCEVYEEGVEKGLNGVCKEYLTYLMEQLEAEDGKTETDRERLIAGLERAVKAVQDAVDVDADTALLASQVLLRLLRAGDAEKLLASSCATSRRADVWLHRIRLAAAPEREGLYSQAIQRVEEGERHLVHAERLQSLIATSPTTSLVSQFHTALTLCPHPSLVTLYVDYLALLLSTAVLTLSDIRSMTGTLPPLPSVASLHLIRLHCAYQLTEDKESRQWTRRQWEVVLMDEEKTGDVEVWREWIRMERENGDLPFANQLIWRAGKHLTPTHLNTLSE